MPTELELIALDTEFTLYLTFVKRLVLDLPNCDDRTRAALWLKKFRSISDPDQLKLRNEHLKLFLFALHRRSLVGIFEKKPPKDELESFHDGLTLMEMTRELIEITEKKKTETKGEGDPGFGVCPLPPVRTNISYDLKEFASFQDIPKFGAHCYYAVSSEPIQLWTKPQNNEFPGQGELPNQLQWELSMSKLTDHILEMEAEIDAQIEAQKQAEQGVVFEEPEVKEEQQQLQIVSCVGAASSTFKWKADSKLVIYQNYDFSNVGIAEDLESQGLHQLETDETALSVLDERLPGRQRVVVRTPFYDGLPPNLSERVHHGVVDEVPELEEGETPQNFCPQHTAEDEDEYMTFMNENNKADEICPCSDNYGDLQQDYMAQSQLDSRMMMNINGMMNNMGNMNSSNINNVGWSRSSSMTPSMMYQQPSNMMYEQPASNMNFNQNQFQYQQSFNPMQTPMYNQSQTNCNVGQNPMSTQSFNAGNPVQNRFQSSFGPSHQSGYLQR